VQAVTAAARTQSGVDRIEFAPSEWSAGKVDPERLISPFFFASTTPSGCVKFLEGTS
jgi:hypothetical protein